MVLQGQLMAKLNKRPDIYLERSLCHCIHTHARFVYESASDDVVKTSTHVLL